MRRFIIIGTRADAAGAFRLDDLPGTSGRMDVLVRCIRAALLVSHGVRRDTVVYLVLEGGERAPRSVRVRGDEAKFLRPDERSLAVLLKKTLAAVGGGGFVTVRPGVALAEAGLDAVLADVDDAPLFVLEAGAPDVRTFPGLEAKGATFVLGDDSGLRDDTRARLAAHNARPVGLGPLEVHSEDAITLLANELDRRALPNP
jgi:tRNA (pseudouridine54-N1)-methyltransferase